MKPILTISLAIVALILLADCDKEKPVIVNDPNRYELRYVGKENYSNEFICYRFDRKTGELVRFSYYFMDKEKGHYEYVKKVNMDTGSSVISSMTNDDVKAIDRLINALRTLPLKQAEELFKKIDDVNPMLKIAADARLESIRHENFTKQVDEIISTKTTP